MRRPGWVKSEQRSNRSFIKDFIAVEMKTPALLKDLQIKVTLIYLAKTVVDPNQIQSMECQSMECRFE